MRNTRVLARDALRFTRGGQPGAARARRGGRRARRRRVGARRAPTTTRRAPARSRRLARAAAAARGRASPSGRAARCSSRSPARSARPPSTSSARPSSSRTPRRRREEHADRGAAARAQPGLVRGAAGQAARRRGVSRWTPPSASKATSAIVRPDAAHLDDHAPRALVDADVRVGPAGAHAGDVPGLVRGQFDRHGRQCRRRSLKARRIHDEAQLRLRGRTGVGRRQARLGAALPTRPGARVLRPRRAARPRTRSTAARWICSRFSEDVGLPAGGMGRSLGVIRSFATRIPHRPDLCALGRPAGIASGGPARRPPPRRAAPCAIHQISFVRVRRRRPRGRRPGGRSRPDRAGTARRSTTGPGARRA